VVERDLGPEHSVSRVRRSHTLVLFVVVPVCPVPVAESLAVRVGELLRVSRCDGHVCRGAQVGLELGYRMPATRQGAREDRLLPGVDWLRCGERDLHAT
jgi:hypothetical protein